MTSITDLGNAAWRDYVTDGDPSSGARRVPKSEVRAVMVAIDIQKAQVVDTLADFRALTSAPDAVLIKGKDAAVDGWGGVFVRVAGSVAPDDEALVLRRTAGGDSYKRLFNPVVMDDNGDAYATRRIGAGGEPAFPLDIQSNSNGPEYARLYNQSAGASATQYFRMQVGSRYLDKIVDYANQHVVHGGSGIETAYYDFTNHFWRSASGDIWASLASGNFNIRNGNLVVHATGGSGNDYALLQYDGTHVHLRPANIGGNLYLGANNADIMAITSSFFGPVTDNIIAGGSGSNRYTVLYAATGSINTSGRDAKRFIGDAVEAEKRAAARVLAIGPRRYKLADACEQKGDDAARWHFGYVAEDVRDALVAEGLDPWAYGFMCRDRVFANKKYTETESRPKTRRVKDYENVVEVRDGKPVRIRKAVERDEPVGTMQPVYDEGGEPVMVEMRNAQGDVALAPMLHFVPEMEEVEVERVRQVDTGVDRLGLRYSELEAFLRCAA